MGASKEDSQISCSARCGSAKGSKRQGRSEQKSTSKRTHNWAAISNIFLRIVATTLLTGPSWRA
eukprot:2439530-Prorocentrum_lima.AAC.1